MNTGLKDLDKLAYDIVCDWPKAVNFNPVFDDIDYSQIIRFYLWDKVGRALRIKNGIDYGEESVYLKTFKPNPFYYEPFESYGTFKKKWFDSRKHLFIPFHTPHTTSLVSNFKEQQDISIISKEDTYGLGINQVIKSVAYKKNKKWANKLVNAVDSALLKLDVTLIKFDQTLLKKQIKGVVYSTDLAISELRKYKPHAIYVHTDNHPPYINYILAGKKLEIPTITYQHGLDCEHYYYNDCFADNVIVWSEERKSRYLDYSAITPKILKNIGNIFLNIDHNTSTKNKNTLLWVTRPHSPSKCYSPSRNYTEGLKILESIIEFMLDNKDLYLIIKTHPMDYVKGLKNLIREKRIENRVIISDDNLHFLFTKASVIISEDTTAGVEAMYYNVPIVHAHFANSKPVLPFVKYKAALPGYNSEQLKSNLLKACYLSEDEKNNMKIGQNKIINRFMPFGKIEDLTSFIIKTLK